VSDPTGVDAEVIVIGAGIIGIYALYRLRESGFDVRTLEQGGNVGGVWYWNRYPGARFDSESYCYAYNFDEELFRDWVWDELFAAQPDIERYINHVVDRYDLRKHVRCNSKVIGAEFDEETRRWTLRTADGATHHARYVVSVTGGLSVPHWPEVEGIEDFGGEWFHTGLYPTEPVDYTGKRVAVVGTGPSGVQIMPIIAEVAESVTVYQRTPNWCTPLNNRSITEEEQKYLRDNFQKIREILKGPSGFLHEPHRVKAADVSREERLAHYEKMWQSPGFAKLGSNFMDMTTNKEANREFCDFLAEKIRGIVKDPKVADKLIPKDHLYGGKRPPFVTGYFEAFNRDNVELVDLKETPMVRVTKTGIETTEGEKQFDIIVWATGFDFGTGALTRMNVVGRNGLTFAEHWVDGPTDFLGFMAHDYPNFFFPGGPHGAGGGNYPRQACDQVDFIAQTLEFMREHGYSVIDPPIEYEEEWIDMVNTLAASSPFSQHHSHYFGANVEGKPRKFLLNPAGRQKLHDYFDEIAGKEYKGFVS
jgi:cation diffusion facilitator CzcD-associated flavoprotein CzcO